MFNCSYLFLLLSLQLKEKIAASMQIVSEDAEDVNNDVRADTPTGTDTQQRLEPLARRSSISTKETQEDERLMSDIASRGEQSTAFQAKVLEMLAPPKGKMGDVPNTSSVV